MSGLTKMLIVLQLVFALVCSVLLVFGVSRLDNYKASVEAANAKYAGLAAAIAKEQANSAGLGTQLANAQKDATTANTRATSADAKLAQVQATSDAAMLETKAQFAAAEARNTELTGGLAAANKSIQAKDDELKNLRPMIVDQNKKLSETYQAKSEADNLLRAAENTIKRLQEQLAQGGGAGAGSVAPLNSEGQISSYASSNISTTPVNGKITAVQNAAGRTLLELPLGTRDGLQVNGKIYVYRDSGYVGEALIQNVTPGSSIAVVTFTKPGETVKEGDLVATVSK